LTDLRRALVLGTLAGTLVLSAACGSSGGDDDSPRDDDSEAFSQSDAQNAVESLLAQYDTVLNQILPQPEVAEDPDDPLVAEFLDLYESGSDRAAQIVSAWRQLGAEDRHTEPYDDEHPAVATRLDGDVEIVSDSELRFPMCVESRQIAYQGDEPVEGTPLKEQAGEGVAVRVDDDWVFRERNVFDGPEGVCATSTTTTPSTTPLTTTEGT
jgi:hypothetical protein